MISVPNEIFKRNTKFYRKFVFYMYSMWLSFHIEFIIRMGEKRINTFRVTFITFLCWFMISVAEADFWISSYVFRRNNRHFTQMFGVRNVTVPNVPKINSGMDSTFISWGNEQYTVIMNTSAAIVLAKFQINLKWRKFSFCLQIVST